MTLKTKKQKESPSPSSSRLQKRIFFAITVSLPVIFFIGLELVLRAMNYGPDLSLFGRQEIRGQMYYAMNPNVKSRYFGDLQFTPATSLHYFQMPKPDGVYRIFCLGGSTTTGYPYYFNASFSSLLDQRLRAIFPKKKIEIINLGISATNSFTVLDIAKELPYYQPDLLIVYDGHNEFYGALGVASNQTIGSSRSVTLLYLGMIHVRTFQLLRSIVQKITGVFGNTDTTVSRGTMMETLARGQEIDLGSSIYDKTYSTFAENLFALKEYCRETGIPLMLGTQVSNIRDQAPFISHYSSGSLQDQSQFQQMYKEGLKHQSQGSNELAINSFTSAIALDSAYADAHYRIAQCFEAEGKKKNALVEYVRARDMDALRFRTDSKFNDRIRSMSDSHHCFVADIEREFVFISPDSIIGYNLTIDHLHPNSRGYFLMAKKYADEMRKNGLFGNLQEWNAADTINEEELWKNRSITDVDERMASEAVKIISSGWPFKQQSAIIEFKQPSDTIDYIAQMMATGNLGWMEGHMQAIGLYRTRGDLNSIEKEYKTIISTYPHIIQMYMDLAAMYFQQRRFDEMKNILLRSLNIYPTLEAYKGLGHILLDKGDFAGAVHYLEKADALLMDPNEKLQNGYAMSFAYAKAGEFQKAKAILTKLLQINPGFQPALQLLRDIDK